MRHSNKKPSAIQLSLFGDNAAPRSEAEHRSPVASTQDSIPTYRENFREEILAEMNKPKLVYFIEAANVAMVKIGIAKNVEKRLVDLQTASPVKLRIIATLPGGMKLEKELHRQFGHLRSHGEWFHLTDEILTYIDRSKSKKGFENND